MQKKLFLPVLLLATQLSFANDESPAITPALQRNFNKQFGMVENVTWKRLNEGYSASFAKDGMAWQASYNEQGRWLHTVRIIFSNQLPLRVLNAVQRKYSLDDVWSIFEYQTEDGQSFYLIHAVDKKNHYHLKYYPDGSSEIIQTVKIKQS